MSSQYSNNNNWEEEISTPDDMSELRKKDFENEINQKNEYAKELLCLAKNWLKFIATLLVWCGAAKVTTGNSPFSDSIMIGLIGSSIGAVLAPAAWVGRNLFKGKE